MNVVYFQLNQGGFVEKQYNICLRRLIFFAIKEILLYNTEGDFS